MFNIPNFTRTVSWRLMDASVIYPVFSVCCFLIAVLFFRKNDVSLRNTLLPFLASLYNPFRMKQHFKIEGIGLIIMGYLAFIVFVVLN